MIKANELRIGNWVYDEQSKSPVPIRGGGIMLIDEGKRNFEAIPLTSEILVSCGFENITHFEGVPTGVYKKNGLNIGLNGDDFVNAQYTVIFDDDICVKVKFLHQLQNLYFALTGEELEVRL